MTGPLVSIITPTYNHEPFIAQCIDSVVAQTYSNWEMIIVDDGSTDQTWSIVAEYARRDQRIKPIRQDHKGIWRLAETYNIVLERTRGELVAILEGDDVWEPSKLSTQVPIHVSSGFALTFARTGFIDRSGRSINREPYPDRARSALLLRCSGLELVEMHLRGEYFVPALTVIVSRDALLRIGGFQQPDYLPVVDYPTWLSIGTRYDGYGYIDAVLARWRQAAGQASWLLASEIAYGAYRFAQELATQMEHVPAGGGGTALERYLLSANRRRYMADACYRSAVIAFEAGDLARAMRMGWEIARLGRHGVLARWLAMVMVKSSRRIGRSARRCLSDRRDAGRESELRSVERSPR